MISHRTVHLAAIAALLAKLACAALTRGTNDADTFYNFGGFIWERGLIAEYCERTEFNHPPLTGYFVALLYGLPGSFGFSFFLRLPGIVADFAVVRLLLARREPPPLWALLLLALSPVSFMVNGFHGNLDGVLAWLLLRAALDCEADRPTRCAVWLGLACQVKIIALLVAPVFFFHWLARGKARPFFSMASAIILGGWAYPLLTIPSVFIHNVLGYSSNWGAWGVTWWLSQTSAAAFAPFGFAGLTPTQHAVMTALKIVIVASTLWLAWSRRLQVGREGGQEIFTTLALVWLVFFTFAPGIGTQYLVWPAPLLLLAAPRAYAWVTLGSSVFCFAFYQTAAGTFPWYFAHSTSELVARWSPWSNAAWLACCAALASLIIGRKKRA